MKPLWGPVGVLLGSSRDPLGLYSGLSQSELQPCAIENLHLGVAKQVSVAVGWVKIKILLMAQLKGLTAKFKLM